MADQAIHVSGLGTAAPGEDTSTQGEGEHRPGQDNNPYIPTTVPGAVAVLSCSRLVLVVLGVVTNVLTCVVCRSRWLRGRSCAVYVLAVTLADLFILLTQGYEDALTLSLTRTTESSLEVFSTFYSRTPSCIITALGQAAKASAAWLTVALGVDRIISVTSLLSRLTFCNPSRAVKVSLSIVVCMLIVYTPASVLIMYRAYSHLATPYLSTCTAIHTWLRQVAIVNSLLAHGGPLSTIVVCCSVLVHLLRTRSDQLTRVTQHDELTANRIRRENSLARPFLVVLAFRALGMAPVTLCRLLQRYTSGFLPDSDISIPEIGRLKYSLSLEVTETISLLTNFSSFYLLLLCSDVFRKATRPVCLPWRRPVQSDAGDDCSTSRAIHSRLDAVVRSQRSQVVEIVLPPHDLHEKPDNVDLVKSLSLRKNSDILSVPSHRVLARMPSPNPSGVQEPEDVKLQEDSLVIPQNLSLNNQILPEVMPTEVLLRQAALRLNSLGSP